MTCDTQAANFCAWLHHSNSRWIWVSHYQNVSILDFIKAKDDGGGEWCQLQLQSNGHHKQTNTQLFLQAGCQSPNQPVMLSETLPYLTLPYHTGQTFYHLTLSSSSSSSQNPAESSAHNASVPDELWAQRDQQALEDIKWAGLRHRGGETVPDWNSPMNHRILEAFT